METVINKVFRRGLSLKTTILTLFSVVALLLTTILAFQLFYFSKKLSLENIEIKLQGLVYNIQTAINQNDTKNLDTITMLSLLNDKSNFELYINLLKTHPALYAIYTGYKDGSFYEIINLNINKNLIKAYNTTQQDRWLLIKIDGSKPEQREIYLYDENLNLNSSRIESSNYNPTKRPWYIEAANSDIAIKTTPYQFSHIDSIGITYSKDIQKSGNVVSLDVLIDDFLSIYENYIDSDSMELFLFKDDGMLISSISKDKSIFKDFLENNKNLEEFESAKIIDIKNKKYIVQLSSVQTLNSKENILLFADYEKIEKPYRLKAQYLLLIFLVTTIFMIPLVIYFSKVIIKPIYELVKQSRNIEKRKYDYISKVETPIYEVSLLSLAFENMSKSIFEYQSSLEEKVELRTKELSRKNLELERLSITDKLTGLYNRVRLDKVLQEEFDKAVRYGNEFCVILIDIDHFKSINDNYGHQIGDDVLKESAEILSKSIRKVDTLGRWGGEEFLIICPQTNLKGAIKVAQNINTVIKEHIFQTYPNKVTLSIGVASFNKNILKPEDIISNADNVLYEAKRTGRDKVVAFEGN